MKFMVLGAGAQGSAAAHDLLLRPAVTKVILADRASGALPPFLEPFAAEGRVERRILDAGDEEALRAALSEVDAALCALPYHFIPAATRAAIAAGTHFCDLGGNTAIVKEQLALGDEAAAAGISVVPDCGLAPGMVNILAQAAIDALDRADDIRLFVGGLPQDPVPPLNYRIVYSMEGVLDYYTTESLVLRDGKIATVEALSEIEPVEFPEPLGTLEAFHTAGGVSLLPERYAGKARSIEYKTLRYPGHATIMEGVRALGMMETDPVTVNGVEVSPRDVLIAAATPRLKKPGGKDLVALRVEARGERDGRATTIRFDLLDRYDEATGITAMMRTTGYSLAATALMQVDGRISLRGVETPDRAVPLDAYLEELARRGIRIERSEH